MKEQLKVIKIGGKLLEERDKLGQFLMDIAKAEGLKILVHGGGSTATEMAGRLGLKTQMIDGRRITDAASLDVIIMTYAGLINKKIVGGLQGLGCNAVGLCGADGKSVLSRKRDSFPVDFGYVGDITRVNADFITGMLKQGILPVFSAITCSEEGQLLNTNADSVAGEIAIALSDSYQTEINFLFGKKGVLLDPQDEDSVVATLDKSTYEQLLEQGVVSQGMLPKLKNSFAALERGVHRILIGNEELIRASSTGTEIIK